MLAIILLGQQHTTQSERAVSLKMVTLLKRTGVDILQSTSVAAEVQTRQISDGQSDRDWETCLVAARSGDAQALDRLWREMRTYLLLVARARLNPSLSAKLDASDIAQQSLLEAQANMGQFQGQSLPEFKAWLRRLVEHNLADTSRRLIGAQRRTIFRERTLEDSQFKNVLVSKEMSASSCLQRNELDVAILRAVQSLSRADQILIRLRYERHLTYPQIGKLLGVSDQAVRKRCGRVVKELQEHLAIHR